jgi:hypothetical protein
MASMSTRALILSVLALTYCGSAAAALCPASGSSSSINCYRGFTVSATYKALPWCNCTCVASSQTYYDYIPVTTQFACSNTTCTNQIGQCTGGYLVSQVAYAQMLTDPLSYVKTPSYFSSPDVAGSICTADTFTCSTTIANNASTADAWCNNAIVGASYSSFDAFAAAFAGDTTPLSDCANRAVDLATYPSLMTAFYSQYTCITDKCNAIPPAAVSSNAIRMAAHQTCGMVLVSVAVALLATYA